MMLYFRTGAAPVGSPKPAPALVDRTIETQAKRRISRRLDVLLVDAELRQTLAAMRVYARAGHAVGAVACESQSWAPSLRSRFCSVHATVPDFSTNANAYVDSLLGLLDELPARMLVPGHDGSIQALRLRRAEIERRTTMPLASESALDIAVSKTRTLAVATELGIAAPRSIPLKDLSDIGWATKEIGFPAVLKPFESWVERDGVGARLSPNVVQTADEAKWTLEHFLSEGGRALLQEWLPGRREAVSLFFANGQFWARMAQVSYREWPVLGGASTLCETIPLLPDITGDAERLVRAIDLEGCSMVEFRRDRAGRPVLMEINPRMGGSVALAISAGVNFPKLMYDWKLERPLDASTSYRVGKRLRWLAGDIWNIKCVFENQGQPDVPPRLGAAVNFLFDFVRPSNKLDGLEYGDMRPALAELNEIVLRPGLGRVRKSPPVKWLNTLGKVN